MWLLDARSVETYPELQSISESDLEIPSEDEKASPKTSYAILSHRWENDTEEISFEDLLLRRPIHEKKGWYKLHQSCQQALSDGYSYVWIDTCCIDKRSSAELQEAINSMFYWYARAGICYAYLRDVTLIEGDTEFRKSEWFDRGWTLQELLAPKDILFFDRDWNFLGDKTSLRDLIIETTSVDGQVLSGTKSISDCSVAARMSWAARRQTTRIEDRAYSLIGIFGINMPMLYGERDKAFMRLQEEIVRRSDDNSIFAWTSSRYAKGHKSIRSFGLLATSPDDFEGAKDIVPSYSFYGSQSYTITNRGLSIFLSTTPHCLDVYQAHLDCSRAGTMQHFSILLRQLPDMPFGYQFAPQFERMAVDGVDLIERAHYHDMEEHHGRRTLLVPQMEKYRSYETSSVYGFQFSRSMLPRDSKGRPLFLVKGGHWNAGNRTVSIPYGTPAQVYREVIPVCFLIILDRISRVKFMAFAFTKTCDPIVFASHDFNLSRCRIAIDAPHSSNVSNLARQAWDAVDWHDFSTELWSAFHQRSQIDDKSHFCVPANVSGMWIEKLRINAIYCSSYGGYARTGFAISRGMVESDGKERECLMIDFQEKRVGSF